MFRSETDTEVARQAASAASTTAVGDLTDGDAHRRAAASRAPSRSSRCTPTAPASSSAPAATARSSSASATARTSSAATSPPSSATPATRSSSARTRSSRSPPTATRSSTSTARPSEGKAYEVTWDAAAAEKGGYATFMEKEINDQPHAVADTLLGRTDDDGRLVLDEVRITEEQLRARRPHHRSSPAAPPPTPAWSPSTRSSTGPASRSRSSLAHEFRYCDPIVDGTHARRLDQPVRRDHGHPDGRQARPRARRHDAVDLQHPRLDDPARVRRRALHPRRPRDRGRLDQGVPRPDHRLLHPRPLPRPAARRAPTPTTPRR